MLTIQGEVTWVWGGGEKRRDPGFPRSRASPLALSEIPRFSPLLDDLKRCVLEVQVTLNCAPNHATRFHERTQAKGTQLGKVPVHKTIERVDAVELDGVPRLVKVGVKELC
ncbi:hypothetical protein AEP_03706 [Curvibacter sp. AEP1-3]|nr:hypothetical protein AEP_03706 [Curvibacter sp. AEP1-3]